MPLFSKHIKKENKQIPIFLVVSFSLLALSLLFLLCFNQSEYMMAGEIDYLVKTIAFFAGMTLSTFADFAVYFLLPKNEKRKLILLFIPAVLEFVFLVVGVYSYLSVYNETVNSIRLPRYVTIVFVFLLWGIGLFSRTPFYEKKSKNQENGANPYRFLPYMPFLLAMIIATMFPFCVFLTMEVPLSHYVFIMLLLVLSTLVITFILMTALLSKTDNASKVLSIVLRAVVVDILFAIAAIIACIIAYDAKAGIAFRSLYWLVASLLSVAIFGALMCVGIYWNVHPEKMPALEDEQEGK